MKNDKETVTVKLSKLKKLWRKNHNIEEWDEWYSAEENHTYFAFFLNEIKEAKIHAELIQDRMTFKEVFYILFDKYLEKDDRIIEILNEFRAELGLKILNKEISKTHARGYGVRARQTLLTRLRYRKQTLALYDMIPEKDPEIIRRMLDVDGRNYHDILDIETELLLDEEPKEFYLEDEEEEFHLDEKEIADFYDFLESN